MQRMIATIFVCLLILAVQPAAAQDGKADLEYLIGSWICEYDWQGAKMVEKTVYSRVDDNTISCVVEVIMNGNRMDEAEGTIVYDPATGLTSSTMTSKMAGFVHTTKEFKREGATSWFEGTSTMVGMMRFRIRIVRDSPDAHTWTMYMPGQNEEWSELMTVVYKRQK